MKVRLAYNKMTACEYYRLLLPSEQMKNIEIIQNDKTKLSMDENKNITHISEPADLVVFPRPAHHLIPGIIKKLQEGGVAVVCEIDDDIKSISPNHAGWSKFQPHLNKEFNWRLAEEACMLADRVVVTTDRLAERYGKHGRVDVIPNYVPQHYIDWSKEAKDRSGIIWPGIIASHPDDLRQVGNSLRQITDQHGPQFVHLGSGNAAAQTRLDASEYTAKGKVALLDYYKAVGEHAIGIAPLEDSKFNDAKSWLKPLEFSALGMPWVGSPSADYKKLNSMGAGILAKRPRQWYSALNKLLTDEEFFVAQQHAGWEVASKLTIEQHYKKWEVSWETALNHRRSKLVNS